MMNKISFIHLVFTGFILGSYFMRVNVVQLGEAGIARNLFNGEITIQDPGIHFTHSWVFVADVDIRPHKVCITTAAHAYNCVLANFKKENLTEFVQTEGFYYYWWANRLSFNSGYSEEYRGWRDLLRGYTFGAQPYTFIQKNS